MDSDPPYNAANNAANSSAVHEIVAKLIAGDLSENELDSFFRKLDSDSNLRREYVAAMDLATQLMWLEGGAGGDAFHSGWRTQGLHQVERPAPSSRWRNSTIWSSLMAISAGLLFLIGYQVGSHGVGLGLAGDAASVPREVGTAVGAWSRMLNCSWVIDGNVTSSIGRDLLVGEEIALVQGIAELTLSSGGTLQVDGPASLVLTSDSTVVMQSGSMVGRLPANAPALDLAVPSGLVRAESGEFGIRVEGGFIDVHAFSGVSTVVLNRFVSAAVEPELYDGTDEDITLRPGEAVRVRITDTTLELVHREKADRNRFASSLPMVAPFLIPEGYVQEVLASRPIGYWRFEEKTAAGEVESVTPDAPPLVMHGDVRFRNSAGNGYIDFTTGSPADALITQVPVEAATGLPGYAIELWFKPSHYQQGMLAGLLERPFTEPHGGAVIELQPSIHSINPRSSRIRYLHRSPPSGNLRAGVSCFSDTKYFLRQWQHLVCSKDGDQMRLYVDGKLTSKGREATPLAGSLHLVCGRLGQPLHQRPYVGQIDELAFYGRALTEDEVVRHYKAAKVSSAPNEPSTTASDIPRLPEA